MSSVDNRVVKMQMENGQFTSAATSTMSTLKKLNESLKLTEGAKGLENISSKAKQVDMSGLASGVESVSNKLSIMDIVGVTALVNIANQAVNTGKRLVSSLTLDPIMDGFREYETKMGAIQTILTNTSSKGTTLDQVNAALAELNEYSDKTIYNFAQMTDNIGKATAAGVGLEDSVTFVKGLANVAAGFGVDATKMAGATYQMTQALSAGVIKLQDWKSLEQSGMGGQMLQDELIKTAQEMGVFVDTSIPFRETLESNWLSSDVFIKTMGKMAENESLVAAAQNVTSFTKLMDTMKETVGSGWAVSWEHILGNKDQSTTLFTNISNGFGDIVGAMSDYRNEALQMWNEEGGREAVLKGLTNIVSGLGKVLAPVYESFKKIIDPWNGSQLISISKAFETWTSKIKISDKAIENLSRTFDGIFSLFSIAGKVIGGVVSGIANLIPLMSPILEGILSITAPIGDFIVKLNETMAASSVFKGAMDLIKNAVSSVSEFIGGFLGKIGDWVSGVLDIDLSGLSGVAGKLIACFTPLDSMGQAISKVIDGIINSIKKFIPALKDFAGKVWDTLSGISQSIIDTIGGKGNGVVNIVNGGLIGMIILGIKKVIDVFKDLSGNVGGIVDSVVDIFDGVKGSLESFQNSLKAKTLVSIATAIAILAGSLLVISTIDSGKLMSALASMGVMMAEIVGAMALLDKVGGGAKVGASMIVFSTAILILSGAMKTLSGLSWEEIGSGLVGLAGMMLILVGASKLMETNSKGMMKTATALVIFAKAIDILTESVIVIGSLKPEVIGQGLVGVGILMGEIALFMAASNIGGLSISKAAAILVLAEALVIMSSAVDKMGSLDKNVLIKGLGSIAIALTEVVLFMKLIGNPKGMISTAIGVGVLAGALLILSNAVSSFGSMNVDVLGTGLLTMGIALGVIAAGMAVMPKNIMGQALSLVVVGGALLIISNAVQNMGSLSWDEIGRGMTVLGGSLGILAIGLLAMRSSISGAAAMIVAAAAIAILTPALIILGGMSLESIGKSLLVLAGAFTVIGVAGLLLTPLTPVLLALAGVIALLGAACVAVGVGISAFAAGMALLAASGAAGAASLVIIITSLVSLIPSIATAIGQGLLNIVEVFVQNSAILAAGIITALTSVIQALIAIVPPLIELVGLLLAGILQLIIEQGPKLVEAVMTIIMSVLEALATNLPIIAGLAVSFIVDLITTILSELGNSIPKVAGAVTDIIVGILQAIGENVPRVVTAAADMIIQMVNGLANAVETKGPEVRAAMKRLIKAMITEFKNAVSDFVSVGGDIIGGVVKGISNGISSVVDAAKNVASSALKAAKNFLGIHSPSTEFAEVGKYSDQGLANGLSKYSSLVEDEAIGVADGALSGMKDALSGADSLFSSDLDNGPVIKPVLDLSEIQNGSNQIGSMLDSNYALKTSMDNARKVSAGVLSGKISALDAVNGATNNTTVNEITNNFNITATDPQGTADEVSKIIQRQVERRDSVWA